MFLDRLEIRGFKSFAQKVEIHFGKGVTAIVGPNGSGKSNIADAIRWVLGEQSAKNLRGGKMEDIIFNGAQGVRAQAYCEVTLVFNNSDFSLPIDYSEVSVMRRVYRSGESEYFLNHNLCRLRDIVDLFRDTGIGKEGYSIIGQGRVEEILSGRSEDRRAVFEEAAGVTKYKARKIEAERKLAKSAENLLRIEDLIQELESRLSPLQEQSERAKQYLKLHEELKIIELNIFLQQYDALKKRINSYRQLLDQAGEEEAALEVEFNEKAEKSQEINDELRKQELQSEEIQKNLLALTAAAHKAEGDEALYQERIEKKEEDFRNLHTQTAVLKQKIEKDRLWLKDARSEGQNKELFCAQIRAKVDEDTALLETETKELESEEKALEERKSAVIESMNRLSNAKVKSSRLETMKNNLLAQKEKSSLDAENAETELESLRLEQKSEGEKEKSLKIQQQSLQDELSKNAEERNAFSMQSDEKNEILRQMERQSAEAKSRLKVLSEMKREYAGFYSSVKKLLIDCQKDSKLGQGIVGVVAELLSVDDEFKTAIEISLGSALQQIVTENEEAAKRAIEHLRARRYGRVTFLPINSINARSLNAAERGFLKRSGCIAVASELIKCENRYKNIFDNLLGRTVIVKDLDSGIALARESKNSFRIATIAGDIINQGGSISGGSTQKSEFSLLGRGRELDKLLEMTNSYAEKIANTKKNLLDIHDKLEAANAVCDEINKKIRIIDIEKSGQNEKIKTFERLIKQEEEKISKIKDEITQIDETILDVDKQLNETQSLQGEIAEIQDISQQDLQAAQQALSNKRQMREDFIEKLNSNKVKLASLEKEIKGDASEIERIEKEYNQCIRDLEDGNESAESNLIQINKWKEELIACQKKHENIETEIINTENQRDKTETLKNELKTKIELCAKDASLLQRKRQDALERKHKAELSVSRTESEWKGIQERIWESYELSFEGAKAYEKNESMDSAMLEKCKSRIKDLGDVNVNAIDDYENVKQRYDIMASQRDDLKTAQADLKKLIENLHESMCERFSDQFKIINKHFSETFQELFNGGNAELRLEDETNVMNSDIEIIVQPPGKRLQLLSLLSGGERALTAIALLFSMLKLKPTPFCILDEIEASLDEANVDLFANYVKRYSEDTQFILITHRKGSMSVCDTLYGVAMEGNGVSKLVSVRLSDAERYSENSA